MADEQPAGPVEHLVTVQCDPASSTLTLQQTSMGVKLGDTVVWQFFGMPDGWSPWIEFRPQENGTSFLGPFTDLTQTAAALWGEVRSDPSLVGQKVVYRVFVQKGIGVGWEQERAAISSAAGTLVIKAENHGTSKTFTVTASQTPPLLQVSPICVDIQSGDTVEWDFQIDSQVPADPGTWRPVVSFTRYEGEGEVPNDYLGPFAALTTGTDRVRGMGNNRVPGSYHFQVSAVRLGDGEILWVSSDDPAIDNRGGVGDPTGGGTGG